MKSFPLSGFSAHRNNWVDAFDYWMRREKVRFIELNVKHVFFSLFLLSFTDSNELKAMHNRNTLSHVHSHFITKNSTRVISQRGGVAILPCSVSMTQQATVSEYLCFGVNLQKSWTLSANIKHCVAYINRTKTKSRNLDFQMNNVRKSAACGGWGSGWI